LRIAVSPFAALGTQQPPHGRRQEYGIHIQFPERPGQRPYPIRLVAARVQQDHRLAPDAAGAARRPELAEIQILATDRDAQLPGRVQERLQEALLRSRSRRPRRPSPISLRGLQALPGLFIIKQVVRRAQQNCGTRSPKVRAGRVPATRIAPPVENAGHFPYDEK
jgi:hypothetical protein